MSELQETPRQALDRIRASFEHDRQNHYDGYPEAIIGLLARLDASGSISHLFPCRSHYALLFVTDSEYSVWKERPFVSVSATSPSEFDVKRWEYVGGALQKYHASSPSEAESQIVLLLAALPLGP